jgi:SRSO17 transposase
MGCLAGCFARVEPRRQARKYVTGLISDLPRKNCLALAEQAGDATPDKMQRLLERAAWDASGAMRKIRAFVVSGLGDPAFAVLVLDESGQQKAGEHSAGVNRQYLGVRGPGGQRHQRRVRELRGPGRARHHRRPAVCARGLGR